MAREKSCNLDKEEAEILKPSSSSSSSSPTPPAVPPATSPASLFHKPPQELPIQRPERPETSAAVPGVATPSGPEEKKPSHKEGESETLGRSANRCSSCHRRVGLTGFRCRCGDLFCALHRYSDTHDCSFDYKAAGREAISKANPLIRAAKIIKI
ncbi:hypothetical protein Taro_027636 [Colocasia esculenta]|uniref:AN1-type domain-containing protein n=1 Tax=Colocasia esculenta TaxID=4460 RepID=A0A843V976_COLES|nr:hypothetical protein [Colocasia esculenta]